MIKHKLIIFAKRALMREQIKAIDVINKIKIEIRLATGEVLEESFRNHERAYERFNELEKFTRR